MKSQILKILRSDNKIVSGEELSTDHGISRVSVWKHIRSLQESGYNIVAGPKGYMIESSPDALFPWEFPERESSIHYIPETSSTMDIARNLARKSCPHFTVVIAGKQKKGRGRLNRIWYSNEGGLYFTLVLRPEIPAMLASRITFLASVVLVQILRKLYDIDAKVKWPNDILVGGKKLCGMLSEMEAEAEMVSFINIGIGVNVNNDPSLEEPGATSLKILKGKEFLRKELLSLFLDEFETRLNTESLDNIIPQWKLYTMTLNQPVKIVTTSDTHEGIAVDIDENGSLILKLKDGTLQKILCGDCFQ
ncbi:MAG: biotin--[acetyl-CoA-carboxylase] ligase [Proteobacteria bacterium]|nr:biotin--[acetyl-CoA-carboxylase] ligase [Pseudomonadota bacterium]